MWSRFSPEKLDAAEKKLIEFSGVEVTSHKIPVDNYNYLYCLTCGDPSNPPFVLLHGYGGSGLMFFRILKALCSRYSLYIVDHLGMGRSTRPRFQADDLTTSEDFFVDSFEQFRKNCGLERFVLAGHSFGGYVAGCYTIKYPQHVEKILFLSTVGVSTTPLGYDFLKELRGDWKFRWTQKIIMFLWVKNITPAMILRIFGPISHKFLGGMLSNRAGSLSPQEEEVMKQYLEQINLLPGSGEYALAHILYPGAWAKYPLCERIHELRIPMAFYYGEKDWVTPDGADQVLEKAQGMVLKYIISNSDHHLHWDNPEETIEKIFDALDRLE